MKYADLHVHTDFSDGTFTPEEVVALAGSKGLSSIAICDHDCVDAIAPSMKRAKDIPIEIVPGVELTVIKDRREIHVLGYFISWQAGWFRKILKRVQRGRIERIDTMIEKLKRFNIKLDRNIVFDLAGNKGSVGRLHMARALFKTGSVSSIQAAFDKYIGDLKPCYVEDVGFEMREAVDLILRAGGVPVLAHPHTIGDDAFVVELIKYGIRGIEVFHSDHRPTVRKKYEEIAKEYGLLITGGSDCHGLAKKRVLLGSVKIPYELVEKLKEEAEKIRAGRT